MPSHSLSPPHSSIWPPQREYDGDAVKTAADKNKWGESRLKKQSEGRAEQLRKNSVLSAVKLFILRDRLVVEIVKNERSSVHLDNFSDVNFNLGSFLLTPATLLPHSMLCLSVSLHLGTVRTPRQMIRSFFYSEIMCGSGRRAGARTGVTSSVDLSKWPDGRRDEINVSCGENGHIPRRCEKTKKHSHDLCVKWSSVFSSILITLERSLRPA